jgi:hypothetical protein
LPKTTTNQLRKRFTRGTRTDEEEVPRTEPPKKKKGPVKLTKDMIQRVDGGGVGLVNPMGWYDGATPDHSRLASRAVSPDPEAKEHGVGVDDVAKNSKPQPLHTTQRAESSMPSVRSSEGSKHKVVSDSTDSGEEVHRRLSASTTASSSNGFDKESDEGKVYSGGADLRQILTTDTLPLSRTQTESIGIRTPYATGPAPEGKSSNLEV